MNSWDTNPWSNFFDPDWVLTCHNKWHPRSSEISTPPETAVGTYYHVWHGMKTTPVYIHTDGEASWPLLPSLVSLLSGGTMQSGNTYFCILKVTGQVWESQKMISINNNHSYHHCSFPKVSLNWSNNSKSVLTNSAGKDGVWVSSV